MPKKKQKNIIECRRVNNFELSGIKKNNLIKPPIIIDEKSMIYSSPKLNPFLKGTTPFLEKCPGR